MKTIKLLLATVVVTLGALAILTVSLAYALLLPILHVLDYVCGDRTPLWPFYVELWEQLRDGYETIKTAVSRK